MKKSDFNYQLPENLIAQFPLKNRGDSRLLMLDPIKQTFTDSAFTKIADQMEAGDLLVLNDTKVIPARLFGKKETGGKIELLLERVSDDKTVICFMRSSKSPKAGTWLDFNGIKAEVTGRQGQYFLVRFEGVDDPLDVFFDQGHIPLPPYIDRQDDDSDFARYQTVFAKKEGAVAAPTAGLHFDKAQNHYHHLRDQYKVEVEYELDQKTHLMGHQHLQNVLKNTALVAQ
jgi:S-adenosylmethionine:tRNA ribosyltransferase-isomerase